MQEVKVTIQLIKQLEVEAGAYTLRIPTTFFIKYGQPPEEAVNAGISAKDIKEGSAYSFRIEINTLNPITFLSAPKHSNVVIDE